MHTIHATETETETDAGRFDRRSLIRAAAWSTPVVAAAITTPLAAATLPQGTPDLTASVADNIPAGLFLGTDPHQMTWGFTIRNIGDGATDPNTVVQVTWLPAVHGVKTIDFAGATVPAGWVLVNGANTPHVFQFTGTMEPGESHRFSFPVTWQIGALSGGSSTHVVRILPGSGGETNSANNNASGGAFSFTR